MLVTVLRESLLKQLDNGAFEPKKLKREKVKEVLLSFRRNLQETARSECRESSVTTLTMFNSSDNIYCYIDKFSNITLFTNRVVVRYPDFSFLSYPDSN